MEDMDWILDSSASLVWDMGPGTAVTISGWVGSWTLARAERRRTSRLLDAEVRKNIILSLIKN